MEISSKGRVKVHWNVTPYDYSQEKAEQLRAIVAKKYGIAKQNVSISKNIITQDNSGNELNLKDSVVDNIQDPAFQKKLFREYLKVNKIDNYDLQLIDKIDTEINGKIDYQVYDKLKHYSIKWVRWSNFKSYGPNNYFDFTKLHNLVLLNSNPANQGGKTSFAVDMLHFLLFGNLKKVKTQSEIYNKFIPEATNVIVEGGLEIDGELYIIKRTLTRPTQDKRTVKSRVSQKVEYYRVIGDEREELTDFIEENGEDVRKTNKIIKESIGREDDFDIIMCITGSNLDALTEEKPTERGRIFSRWIGLLPLEYKDTLAREKFNTTIKPKLLSGQYNKEELIQEVNAFDVCNKEISLKKDELVRKNKEIEKEINGLEKKREDLNAQKLRVDQDVLKIDITTLNNNIESWKNAGIRKKEQLEQTKAEIADIGQVEFSIEEYDQITDKFTQSKVDLTKKRVEAVSLKDKIKILKTSEYCPTCKRKLDNVDNTEQIKGCEEKYNELVQEGREITERVNELETKLSQMKSDREKYNQVNKLNAMVPVLTYELENLRNEYKGFVEALKKYRENADAIDKNNEIDNALRMNESNIIARRDAKENNLKQIIQIENDISNNIKQLESRKALISQMTEEEKLVANWKIYLDMVGKNGISKMVMKKALPIINARLSQLLEDVCDFDISIEINSSNEVEFFIIQNGVKASLYSDGSGFEKTAAALALRSVLAEVSTISKSNFVIIDEILGRTARENFDNMKNLYEKIARNYDFVFHVTHNEEVKEWHNSIVTIKKENNISMIEVTNAK